MSMTHYPSQPLLAVAHRLFFQLMRFGLVGASATAIHGAAYLTFVTAQLLTPFFANLAAYAIAFTVSFLGHRYWTFGDAERGGRNNYAAFRFVAVSLSGLAFNSVAVLILINHFRFADWTPLLVIVGVTPIFTFLFNRFWVFYTLRSA